MSLFAGAELQSIFAKRVMEDPSGTNNNVQLEGVPSISNEVRATMISSLEMTWPIKANCNRLGAKSRMNFGGVGINAVVSPSEKMLWESAFR